MADATLAAPGHDVQQLYLFHHADLQTIAYDTYPELKFWDCDAILSNLQGQLPTFPGQTDEEFAEWAGEIVAKGATRYKFLYLALTEWEPIIYSAIQRGLASEHNRAVDYSKTPEDIYWEIVPLIVDKAPDLAKAGTAKLTSRIFALAKKHVRFYVVQPMNRRHEANRKRVASGLPYFVPTTTAEEHNTNRAAHLEEA